MIQFNNERIADNDRQLERRVREFLDAHSVPSLRRLGVVARDGSVTLQGQVKTFYEKQLSLQCSRRVEGVREFIDQVDVERTPGGARDADGISVGQTFGVNGKP